MKYTSGNDNRVRESYEYSYDKNSNITSRAAYNDWSADGRKVDETRVFTYDEQGGLTRSSMTNHIDNDSRHDVLYTYDEAGNRTKVDSENGTTEYT